MWLQARSKGWCMGGFIYHISLACTGPEPLFTKWTDVSPHDPVKPRSREIQVQTFPIALKFDRHLGSTAVEMPVKFHSDTIYIIFNLVDSRLHEIWGSALPVVLMEHAGIIAWSKYVILPHMGSAGNHWFWTLTHMMTSSKGDISTLLAICAGNSLVTCEFPAQKPVTRSFDIFFICAWINGWVNNREADDLWRHRAYYGVTVMLCRVGSDLLWHYHLD